MEAVASESSQIQAYTGISTNVNLGIFFSYNLSHRKRSIQRQLAFLGDCKMIIRVLLLVFLFFVRLRFPSDKSIANTIRSGYNDEIAKEKRRFKDCGFKIRKNEAVFDFLRSCQQNNIIPKFLYFKVTSSSLRFSWTYKQCQRQLLKQEIKEKVSIISKRKKEFTALKTVIKTKLSIMDFAHIFLVGNDKKITKVKETHRKKLKLACVVNGVVNLKLVFTDYFFIIWQYQSSYAKSDT